MLLCASLSVHAARTVESVSLCCSLLLLGWLHGFLSAKTTTDLISWRAGGSFRPPPPSKVLGGRASLPAPGHKHKGGKAANPLSTSPPSQVGSAWSRLAPLDPPARFAPATPTPRPARRPIPFSKMDTPGLSLENVDHRHGGNSAYALPARGYSEPAHNLLKAFPQQKKVAGPTDRKLGAADRRFNGSTRDSLHYLY